jgi:hypothetical protein
LAQPGDDWCATRNRVAKTGNRDSASIDVAEILDHLRARDPRTCAEFPRAMLLRVLAKACLAVAYAHSRCVVHRDIKPDNLIVGDFGESTFSIGAWRASYRDIPIRRFSPIRGSAWVRTASRRPRSGLGIVRRSGPRGRRLGRVWARVGRLPAWAWVGRQPTRSLREFQLGGIRSRTR